MGILSLLMVVTKPGTLENVLYPFLQSTWCIKKKEKKNFAAGQFLSSYFGQFLSMIWASLIRLCAPEAYNFRSTTSTLFT